MCVESRFSMTHLHSNRHVAVEWAKGANRKLTQDGQAGVRIQDTRHSLRVSAGYGARSLCTVAVHD
jgi:hypothetical protein